MLKSRVVREFICSVEAERETGRKGYGMKALLAAILARHLYGLRNTREIVKLIAEHTALAGCVAAR